MLVQAGTDSTRLLKIEGMEIILSIIVPVFNVQRYIGKCVDSLLSQDLDEDSYEIILVNDGSVDDSGRICDFYALEHSNVSVIHQKNQGLSIARNNGLRIARGRYVLFVDSDDFLQCNVLNELMKRMLSWRLDILRFVIRRVHEKEKGEGETLSKQRFSSSEGEVVKGHVFLVNRLGFECYACQFLFRRSLLVDNGLFFRPGIIYEDTEWTPRVLELAERVMETDLLVYNYYEREGSITNDRAEKVVHGQLVMVDILQEQMRQLEDKRWHQGMIAHTVVSIITLISIDLYPNRATYLNELRKKKIYPLSSFMASKSSLRKIAIINQSPRLACFLIHVLNAI